MKASDLLVGALGYIKRFSGQTFVIKLGGEVMIDKKVFDTVIQDVILLNTTGIKTVILHGGGPEISQVMDKFGKKPAFVKGLRVTDQETMDIVEMVLNGKINTEIVSRINALGGNAVGLSGKSGKLFMAEKKKGEVDLGMVGEITKVNTDIVETFLHKNYIPVVSPVGMANDGKSLNINADTAAGKLAVALRANKIIFLTNVKGVLDENKKLIKELTVKQSRELIKKKTASGGMVPKLESAVFALEHGVEKAHIIQAQEHAVLEEILTKEGIGTMVSKK